ncbi:MAG: hypothetical protein MUF06_24290 [Pirellulaceae bacterium]|nr:hypothetical protein [Pirellulaceae bacterium]
MICATYPHLRLPIVLAASLLVGVAGDEWLTCWLPHSPPADSTSIKPPPHSAASPLSIAADPTRHPANGDELASSNLD